MVTLDTKGICRFDLSKDSSIHLRDKRGTDNIKLIYLTLMIESTNPKDWKNKNLSGFIFYKD
jgi:hypothetical protein